MQRNWYQNLTDRWIKLATWQRKLVKKNNYPSILRIRKREEGDFQDRSQFGEHHTISITRTVQPKEKSQNLIVGTTFHLQLQYQWTKEKEQGIANNKGDRSLTYKDDRRQPAMIWNRSSLQRDQRSTKLDAEQTRFIWMSREDHVDYSIFVPRKTMLA